MKNKKVSKENIAKSLLNDDEFLVIYTHNVYKHKMKYLSKIMCDFVTKFSTDSMIIISIHGVQRFTRDYLTYNDYTKK